MVLSMKMATLKYILNPESSFLVWVPHDHQIIIAWGQSTRSSSLLSSSLLMLPNYFEDNFETIFFWFNVNTCNLFCAKKIRFEISKRI